MESHNAPPAVAARGIVKRFRNVVANGGVSLEVREGEIVALVGENGAGKSTLMNILSGYLAPDEGELELWGEPVRLRSPADAIARGVGMVHQHFMLVGPFTALENIVLGQEPASRAGLMDLRQARQTVTQLMTRYGLEAPLDVPVERLGVGERQRIEIIKALYRRARVLILDEPTSVLTPQEVDRLFEVLRELRADGTTILFITHKLAEVMSLADRIGVMRAGLMVAMRRADEVDPEALAELIVGRRVERTAIERSAPGGETLLELREVGLKGNIKGRAALTGISFTVRRGEIVGIAGVLGNGQRELEEILTGQLPADQGAVIIRNEPAPPGGPAAFLAAGVAHIPEDRRRQGLIMPMRVSENLMLGRLRKRAFVRWGLLRHAAIRREARRAVGTYDVRPARPSASVRNLSGGNQQKVVLAREMEREAALLVAAHPTRGLDVGATRQIHERLLAMRAQGGGVILISADLDELLTLCDRIGVLYQGQLVAMRPAGEWDERKLGAIMIGGKGGKREERSMEGDMVN